MARNKVWYFQEYKNIKEAHSVSWRTHKNKVTTKHITIKYEWQENLKGNQRNRNNNYKIKTSRLFISHNRCQKIMKWYLQSTKWK